MAIETTFNLDLLKRMSVKSKLDAFRSHIAILEKDANDLVKGKTIKILSDYNGQPYGQSKRSLKGECFTVTGSTVESDGIWLYIKEHNVGLNIEEVEFID